MMPMPTIQSFASQIPMQPRQLEQQQQQHQQQRQPVGLGLAPLGMPMQPQTFSSGLAGFSTAEPAGQGLWTGAPPQIDYGGAQFGMQQPMTWYGGPMMNVGQMQQPAYPSVGGLGDGLMMPSYQFGGSYAGPDYGQQQQQQQQQVGLEWLL